MVLCRLLFEDWWLTANREASEFDKSISFALILHYTFQLMILNFSTVFQLIELSSQKITYIIAFIVIKLISIYMA